MGSRRWKTKIFKRCSRQEIDRKGCGLKPSSSSPYGIRANPSLTLSSGDPRTREAARLRAGSPQEVWSPAAREATAVRRWRRMVRSSFPSGEREGEREAVKVDLSGLTAVKEERRVYPR
jgi:hypothetical protein